MPTQFARGIQPLGLRLHSQAKQIVFGFLEREPQLLFAHIAEFCGFHVAIPYAKRRRTIRTRTGIL